MTVCASASAVTVHRAKPRHIIVRPGQGFTSGYAVPGWAYAPPRAYAPPPPVVHYDDTPSYDDPSKFGGG
jgi:hypothetical protein